MKVVGHMLLVDLIVIAVGIPLAIPLGLLNYIVTWIGNYIAILIINGVLGALAAFVVYGLFQECYFEEEQDYSVWRDKRDQHKKVSPLLVHVMLILILAAVIGIVMFLVLFLKYLDFEDFELRVIFGLLCAEGFYWLVAWIVLNVHYCRWTHCHAVHCFKYVSSSDHFSRQETQSKTRSNTETVGSVYSGYKKIADVKRNTTQTYNREVTASGHKDCYRCIFCGHEKSQRIVHVQYGDWK